MPAGKRPLGGRLDEIVGIDGGASKPACEATEPWQQRYQLIAKPVIGHTLVWYPKRRQFRQPLPWRQRTSFKIIPSTTPQIYAVLGLRPIPNTAVPTLAKAAPDPAIRPHHSTGAK